MARGELRDSEGILPSGVGFMAAMSMNWEGKVMVPAARDYDPESICATILGAMEKQSTPPLLNEPPTTADTLCPRSIMSPPPSCTR